MASTLMRLRAGTGRFFGSLRGERPLYPFYSPWAERQGLQFSVAPSDIEAGPPLDL
jgi:hypothetical protein